MSEADSENSVIKSEIENVDEVGTELPTSTQSTSNQFGSVGSADQTDSALIVQIREVFGQNVQRVD